METDSSLELTQSEDNEALQKLMLTEPLCNPVLCKYVEPKTNENDLKVSKENTFTMDFLIRGVSDFKDLRTHLQTIIFAKCVEFQETMHKAYVSCIKLYHFQYTSKLKWDDRMYNLKLPCMNKYLQDSFFCARIRDTKRKIDKQH
jgi:hypothetical protein